LGECNRRVFAVIPLVVNDRVPQNKSRAGLPRRREMHSCGSAKRHTDWGYRELGTELVVHEGPDGIGVASRANQPDVLLLAAARAMGARVVANDGESGSECAVAQRDERAVLI